MNFLSNEQVSALNEKHGYFQSADAQGDVSRAFAQEAIELHERIRSAAPAMLSVLEEVSDFLDAVDFEPKHCKDVDYLAKQINAAIRLATNP